MAQIRKATSYELHDVALLTLSIYFEILERKVNNENSDVRFVDGTYFY